jgi:hypothetical protein
MPVSQDPAEAEAVLEESRTALDVLTRLVTKLEVFVDRLETELERTPEQDGDGDGEQNGRTRPRG